MIRIVDVLHPRNAAERARLARLQELFRTTFTGAKEYADKIPGYLAAPEQLPFGVLVRTLEDGRGRLLAFAIVHVYSDLGAAYLDFIASPSRKLPGRGAALYEHVREELRARGVTALFMDVPPDEPSMVKDPAVLPANQARLAFYETYGARPIEGTLYDGPPPLGQDYDPPFLVVDRLDSEEPLRRTWVRKVVKAILVRRYGWEADDAHTKKIVESFRDDPLRLRSPRYPRARAPAVVGGMPLTVVIPGRHDLHHVQQRGYVERPARVSAIVDALQGMPVREVPPKPWPLKHTLAVHDRDFVHYLDAMAKTLGEKETLYPYVFPIRRPDRKPKDAWVRAGYYCIDTFTPLSRSAVAAAHEAVDCALTAADEVLKGAALSYAVCRPPGHHAERKVFGGFCYFNNAAIAAHHLSAHGKVAFIDVDHHHGNGSQDIFYERDDVLFVSLHGDPRDAYPYFSGFADETGQGRGEGFNLNLPLPEGTDDERYLKALDKALKRIRTFAPRYLVVSLGVDIMKGDPTGMFTVSARGMRDIGARLGALKLPTVVVQEGGYRLQNLRRGVRAFFTGMSGGP